MSYPQSPPFTQESTIGPSPLRPFCSLCRHRTHARPAFAAHRVAAVQPPTLPKGLIGHTGSGCVASHEERTTAGNPNVQDARVLLMLVRTKSTNKEDVARTLAAHSGWEPWRLRNVRSGTAEIKRLQLPPSRFRQPTCAPLTPALDRPSSRWALRPQTPPGCSGPHRRQAWR